MSDQYRRHCRPGRAARPALAPRIITLKVAPLPRLANGRVDSNAVFARIAASRAG
ncbi:hypothetical protein LP419_39000 [Massilia sp. H-1]|nr:hypothetical protein LP419_39000 [Massilia sp. H-1]